MIRAIFRSLLAIIVSAILVTAGYLGGFVTSYQIFPPPVAPDGDAPADWKPYIPVFWEAWNYVHQDFYKPLTDDKPLAYAATSGMVQSLGDQFTIFLEPRAAEFSRADLAGSFEGIGATVEMREGRLTIVSPIKGTPADLAGLAPGDIILKVNDTVIQDMDINKAISLIRGPKGTTVTLTVQRAKQSPFEVRIVRDRIRVDVVESRMIEGTTIGYIKLNEFNANAPEEFRAALQKLNAQHPSGLIVDIRRNPGGFLDVAIEIASHFLKKDQAVLIEQHKDGSRKTIPVRDGGLAKDIPMVLLVDKGSASASEILSAALKDYKRATLIGVTTFGKGAVNLVHTLNDKSELRVTAYHYLSPLGNEIHEIGVTPDIKVENTPDDIAKRRDPQLDKAIEVIKKLAPGASSLNVPEMFGLGTKF